MPDHWHPQPSMALEFLLLSFSSCGSLSKRLKLSEPQIPHLQSENNAYRAFHELIGTQRGLMKWHLLIIFVTSVSAYFLNKYKHCKDTLDVLSSAGKF